MTTVWFACALLLRGNAWEKVEAADETETKTPRASQHSICDDSVRDAKYIESQVEKLLSPDERRELADFFAALRGAACINNHLKLLHQETASGDKQKARAVRKFVLAVARNGDGERELEAYATLYTLATPPDLCQVLIPAVERGELPAERAFSEDRYLWRLMELPAVDLQRGGQFAAMYRDFGVYAWYLNERAGNRLGEFLSSHRKLLEHMFRVDPNKALKVFVHLASTDFELHRSLNTKDLGDLKQAVEAAIWFKGKGRIGLPALAESLERLRPLTDAETAREWYLRLYAAEVLAQYPVLDDGEGFRERMLLRLREDPDESVRRAAKVGLQQAPGNGAQ